jgi:hypothetical protein
MTRRGGSNVYSPVRKRRVINGNDDKSWRVFLLAPTFSVGVHKNRDRTP